MESTDQTREATSWVTKDPEMVARVVEEILQDEVWWMAVRSGKYACGSVIWVDGCPGSQTEASKLRSPPGGLPASTLENV